MEVKNLEFAEFIVLAPLVVLFMAMTVAFSAYGTSLTFLVVLVSYLGLLWSDSRVLLVSYLVGLLFQSVIISAFSNSFESRGALSFTQGLTFVVLSVAYVKSYVGLYHRDKYCPPEPIDKLFTGIPLALLACLAYLLYGIAANGFQGAVIYFRTVVAVLFLVAFGYYCGASLGERRSLLYVRCISMAAIVFGVLEILIPEALYSAINATEFFALKFEGRYTVETLDDVLEFAKRPLLNLAIFKDLDLYTFRLSGPNLHPISYAYFLATCVALFVISKRYVWAALAIVLLLSIQAKGPFIILILSSVFLLSLRVFPKKLAVFFIVTLSIFYVTAATMYGIRTRDFHVLGLLGGVNGFLSQPLGHGLGAGGNLVRAEFNWQDFQNSGAAAFGVESAIGVLLYQMGIGAFALFVFYVKFSAQVYNYLVKSHRLHRYRILPIMFYVTFLNGFFQEEAINFFGLGLLGFIVAILIGAERYSSVSRSGGSSAMRSEYSLPSTA